MRKFKFFAIAILLATVFVSCNEADVIPTEAELEFVDIQIPNGYKTINPDGLMASNETETHEMSVTFTKVDGSKIQGKFRITVPSSNKATLSKLDISSNLMREAQLDNNFWNEFRNQNSPDMVLGVEGSCIADCIEKTKKKKDEDQQQKIEKNGRGWCKAGCWVNTAAAVVVAAATLIAAVG